MTVYPSYRDSVLLSALAALVAAGLAGCSEPESEIEQIQEFEDSGNVDALAERALEAEPEVGRHAVRSLGRLGPKAEPALRQVMEKGKPTVRAEAALVYPRVSSRQKAQEPLATISRRDPEPYVRASALTALGRMRALDSMEAIIEALNDPDLGVRRRAADAVARIMGLEYELYLDGPEEKRLEAIEVVRKSWNHTKNFLRQYYERKAKRRRKP